MEQILITHRDGTSFELRSRGKTISNVIELYQDIELNGNDTVTLNVESTELLPFSLGDTITIGNMIYTLNLLPSVEKVNPRHFKIKAVFEGLHYLLLNTAWLMPFSAINDTLAGTLNDFANQIVANLNRVYNGIWEVGIIKEDTETKVLCYEDTNCLDVLQNICEEWEVEFYISKTNNDKFQLSIVDKVGSNIDYIFRYGAGGGLYDLQRNGVNDPDFGTRIYFYGGSNNISNEYFNLRQSSRLCLPNQIVGSMLTPNPIKNQSYIEQPDTLNLYGRIERTKIFDEIYPNRTGFVTAIDTTNELKFVDETMFNLNETDDDGNTLYLIAGTTAKIHFNTGALAGYDFDITKYDHTTHTFTVERLQDENNYEFPSKDNSAFRVAVGDEYIITDIILPIEYITEAENKLQKAAQDWYELHCAPNVEYSLNMDEFFLSKLAKDLNITKGNPLFNVGDTISVTDLNLWNGTKQFRVISMQRNLLKEHSYTLQIAVTDEYRRRYLWRVKKEKQTQTLFDRLGFTAVGYSANRGFELHKQNRNSSQLLVLYDTTTGRLRPTAIGDGAIIERMINNGAITVNKIKDGAITASKIGAKAIGKGHLDTSIRVNTERLTSQIYFDNVTDKENPHIVISAGNYTNSMLDDKILDIKDQIVSTDFEGHNIQSDKDYYIYIDKENNNVCVSVDLQDDTSRFIHIGMLAKELKSDTESADRAVILRAATTEAQDYVFRDEKGEATTVKTVSKIAETAKTEASTAKTNATSALNKASSIENIVGIDNEHGLRKEISSINNIISDNKTGIGAMIEAIEILKTSINGISYEDCKLQACKTLNVAKFPWEK